MSETMYWYFPFYFRGIQYHMPYLCLNLSVLFIFKKKKHEKVENFTHKKTCLL